MVGHPASKHPSANGPARRAAWALLAAVAVLIGLASPAMAGDTRPPTTPTNLRSAPGVSTVALTWTASKDNVGVRYYLVTVGGQTRRPTATKISVGNLKPATRYTATVRAVDGAGNRSRPVSVTVTTLPAGAVDTIAPTPPGPVVVGATTATSAQLTWGAASDNVGVTAYLVTPSGLPTTTVSGTDTTLTGLSPDTTYTIAVVARDAAGNLSAPVTAEVRTPGTPADVTAPSPPTGLVATGVTTGGAELAWVASIDAVGVTGYRVTVDGRTLEVTAPAASLSGLEEARTYAVSVVAVDAAGNLSAPGTVNFRTPQSPDVTAPSAATVSVVPGTTSAAVVVGGASDDRAVLRYWVMVGGQTLQAGSAGTVVARGLAPATAYTVKVVVRDPAGNEAPPTTADFTTKSATPGPDAQAPETPADLGVVAGSTALTVRWAPAADDVEVDHYEVTVGDDTLAVPTPSGAVEGLSPDTTYPVRVSAVDAAGNVSAPAQLTVTTRPAPAARGLAGNIAWFGKGTTRASMDEALASPLIDGLSVFARWGDLTQDGTSFDFSFFDTARSAAAAAGKPWKGMIVLGVAGKGMPAYVLDALPANERITIGGETFPVFWSESTHQAAVALQRAVAQRYGSDPNLVQWRVTGLWSVNGEPWFLGGATGRQTWLATYRLTHPGATIEDLRTAYDAYERQIWSDAAGLWPARVRLSQAAGDAIADTDTLVPVGDPARHPHRLATWSAVRAELGERMVGQFNGVDDGIGAAGYGVWLPAAFGPAGRYPGRIGAQAIGGVSQDTRLTAESFREMTRLLTERGYSYGELYGTDVLYALRGVTPEARSLRETLAGYHGAWRP